MSAHVCLIVIVLVLASEDRDERLDGARVANLAEPRRGTPTQEPVLI